MIDVDLVEDRLRLHFTRAETVVGLVHDLDEPLTAITSAALLRDPWHQVRGWRIGLRLPGVWMLGTWWRRNGRQLVALRRAQPALRIRLRGSHYDELLVSTRHPAVVLSRLRERGVRDDSLVLVSGAGAP